jgi:hypothetical protein
MAGHKRRHRCRIPRAAAAEHSPRTQDWITHLVTNVEGRPPRQGERNRGSSKREGLDLLSSLLEWLKVVTAVKVLHIFEQGCDGMNVFDLGKADVDHEIVSSLFSMGRQMVSRNWRASGSPACARHAA